MRFTASLRRLILAVMLLSTFSIGAVDLPRPRENVLRLEKPTILYTDRMNYEIRLIDWDGQNDRIWMADEKKKTRFPSGVEWSPDGKRAAIVAFDTDSWTYATFVLDLSTNKAENVVKRFDGKYSLNGPAWSKDGGSLVMFGFPITNEPWTGETDLYRLRLASGRLTNLTNALEKYNQTPSWVVPESDGIHQGVFLTKTSAMEFLSISMHLVGPLVRRRRRYKLSRSRE